jgi:hypothetical protein
VSAARGPDRVGKKCGCGCGRKVPPFVGKGSHAKLYFNAACGARVRVARWEANNPELAAERKKACKRKVAT